MKNPIRRLTLVALATFAAGALAHDAVFVVEDARLGDGPITVEQRRAPSDARIQQDVMARLRAMQHIEGLVGVETNDSVVRLTGIVTTSGQAFRAGREALNAAGVKKVENDLRSKVGASF